MISDPSELDTNSRCTIIKKEVETIFKNSEVGQSISRDVCKYDEAFQQLKEPTGKYLTETVWLEHKVLEVFPTTNPQHDNTEEPKLIDTPLEPSVQDDSSTVHSLIKQEDIKNEFNSTEYSTDMKHFRIFKVCGKQSSIKNGVLGNSEQRIIMSYFPGHFVTLAEGQSSKPEYSDLEKSVITQTCQTLFNGEIGEHGKVRIPRLIGLRQYNAVAKKTTKLFECDICEYTTTRKCRLEQHIRTYNGEMHKSKARRSTAVRKSTLTNEKPFKCDFCNYSTSKSTCFLRHTRTHTGEKPFKCNFCNYSASVKNSLILHIRTHTGEKPFKCEVCEYSASVKCKLVQHIRTHTGEKPHKCELCNYCSGTRTALVKHIRKHTGEEPHKCEHCGYGTSVKAALVQHIRTHTGERPFLCDMCDYAATAKDKLVLHIRSHTGEKPFACELCDYRSSGKARLKQHLRTHVVEHPFKCQFCDYSDTRKSQLVRHMRSHGNTTFKCKLCAYTASDKITIVRHVRSHSKPFKCGLCGNGYSYKGKLVRHLQTHTVE